MERSAIVSPSSVGAAPLGLDGRVADAPVRRRLSTPLLAMVLCLVWGITAVADSPQFSAAVAELSEAQALTHIGSWDWDVAADRLTWSDETYRITGIDRSVPDHPDQVGQVPPHGRGPARPPPLASHSSRLSRDAASIIMCAPVARRAGGWRKGSEPRPAWSR